MKASKFVEAPKALTSGRMRALARERCIGRGVPIRGARRALRFDTPTFRYKSRRTDRAAVARRIREIRETHVPYGDRRVLLLH
ncbi:MAG: hypothetical protein KDK53_02640 [Maritimibacter sp.]|nr:hypothetical protein [Maritimibacter sp.]